jgi:hypothetical protein
VTAGYQSYSSPLFDTEESKPVAFPLTIEDLRGNLLSPRMLSVTVNVLGKVVGSSLPPRFGRNNISVASCSCCRSGVDRVGRDVVLLFANC